MMMIPCIAKLPPIGERVQIFIAGHDHLWSYGTWDGKRWQIDSREVFDDTDPELVTHWAPEPPSPFDLVVSRENIIDAVERLGHEPLQLDH